MLRHGAEVRIRAGGPYRAVSAPRMQALSLASALLALRESEWNPGEIILHSPCSYIVDNVPRVHRWVRQGRMRRHDGNPVKNADIWRQVAYRLDQLPPVRCVRLAEGVDLDQQRAIGLARYRARRDDSSAIRWR